eukprot:1159905-Pelagomonas_calceolata.AAC.8
MARFPRASARESCLLSLLTSTNHNSLLNTDNDTIASQETWRLSVHSVSHMTLQLKFHIAGQMTWQLSIHIASHMSWQLSNNFACQKE